MGGEPLLLCEENTQLMREFQYLQQEVDDFRHFDQLMDSGIMARVKELKHKFGTAFYHPTVLSLVAVYNAFFGKRFDDLFAKALGEIKNFGQALEEMGGTILTTVDGVEVTNPSYVGAVLDPNSIDHVEVIRGPQASTIYGSEAPHSFALTLMGRVLYAMPHVRIFRDAGGLIRHEQDLDDRCTRYAVSCSSRLCSKDLGNPRTN